MRLPVSRILVFFTLLLYLAAASAASLHGIPMSIQDVNQDCHSSSTVHDEKPDSVACKIFCSIMAQAISIDYSSPLIKTSHELYKFQLVQSHLSFKNLIELKPPKHFV